MLNKPSGLSTCQFSQSPSLHDYPFLATDNPPQGDWVSEARYTSTAIVLAGLMSQTDNPPQGDWVSEARYISTAIVLAGLMSVLPIRQTVFLPAKAH
jgi:hypothetical protein